MIYRSIKKPKISDIIMEELEGMILEGHLKPGQLLPPGRKLARLFEVSRPTLSEAVHKLEAKGLLKSLQGDGTYVADPLGGSFLDPSVTPLISQA